MYKVSLLLSLVRINLLKNKKHTFGILITFYEEIFFLQTVMTVGKEDE